MRRAAILGSASLGALSLLLLSWTSARADIAAEFNGLQTQFNQQISAARFADAERTAARLREMAEGPLRDVPYALQLALTAQGRVFSGQGRLEQAIPLYQWLISVYEGELPARRTDLALVCQNLAQIYVDQSKYTAAQPLIERAVSLWEQSRSPHSADYVLMLNTRAIIELGLGNLDEAERFYRRMLAEREANPALPAALTATALSGLGGLNNNRGRFVEAQTQFARALAIREAAFGAEHPEVSATLQMLGLTYYQLGRFADAEATWNRALAIREKSLGTQHVEVAATLANLAQLSARLGKYADAEPRLERALALIEKAAGTENALYATLLNNQGALCLEQGRAREGEAMLRKCLALRCKVLGAEHPDAGQTWSNLGRAYADLGRFADAEPALRTALEIWQKTSRQNIPEYATCQSSLAFLYESEDRLDEAQLQMRQALTLRERLLGAEHPDVAVCLSGLARVESRRGRHAEAEQLERRALAIAEKGLGKSHPEYAARNRQLAGLLIESKQYAAAAEFAQRAAEIHERAIGPNGVELAKDLVYLAAAAAHVAGSNAEQHSRRAVEIFDRAGAALPERAAAHGELALFAWHRGDRKAALAHLRQALELAETLRTNLAGAERERAAAFAGVGDYFERLLLWQTELGDCAAALDAIERSRARTLLDEMAAAGVDLDAGRTPAEIERWRAAEARLKQQAASLKKRAELLPTSSSADAQRRELEEELQQSRAALYAQARDYRSSSPAYRKLLGTGAAGLSLTEVRRLVPDGTLLLAYFFGAENGYLLAIGAHDEKMHRLTIAADAAAVLGVEAGPLTAARFNALAFRGEADGLVQQLHRAPSGPEMPRQLAALWRTLVPDSLRAKLLEGSLRRLIVIPDGPLAYVPFETLVVAEQPNVKFLLDAGPPVCYGPSATVLLQLMNRTPTPASDREPVLTVGNPTYAPAAPPADSRPLRAANRYHALGGKLAALPYTDWETRWVVDVFGEQGIRTLQLTAASATEANVRNSSTGRRFVHLACHGFTDPTLGNFFGALALTPGPGDDADDDGFLTLAEICQLDLRACDLALLSACETNAGPQQWGEGVWALSRGFLVAGAKRVVASNWLVDDEASASLISYTCSQIAAAEKEQRPVDYARALQAAKRLVRNNDKWRSPFYWAPFVLVGP